MLEFGDNTVFSVHSDDAPTVYVKGKPGPTDAVTRGLERNMAKLVAFDPIKGGNVPLMKRMADPAEMAFLHMVTNDPARTPTFTYFADDDFFLTAASKPATCSSIAACSNEQPGFNWNHGDFQEQITRTWLGLVGPGIRNEGRTGEFFSDHTDIRPTLLTLAGLKDDYTHDGRALFEVLDEEALPHSLKAHDETLSEFGKAFKAINAPRGELARKTLEISTQALAGDDATYTVLEQRINDITNRRNAIAQAMTAMLEDATFNGKAIDEGDASKLIEDAENLLGARQ